MNSLNCQFLSKMCLSVLHHQNAGGFQWNFTWIISIIPSLYRSTAQNSRQSYK
jgi:hypothetical protein